MKVEELMIGDWFYWEINGKKYPTQVCEDTFGLTNETISNFHPIPITNEILKKNGFVNSYIDLSLNKDSVYKYNHFYTGNSVIVDMESNKLIVKYDNDIWMNLPYNRTIYVHELQHVLKHCEIKKEIII